MSNNLEQSLREISAGHQQDSQQILWRMAQPLFAKHSDLVSFAWAQYSDLGPWGDGFHADTDIEMIFVNDDIRYGDLSDLVLKPGAQLYPSGKYMRYRLEDHIEVDTEFAHLRPTFHDVADVLSQFDERMLWDAFGDHAKVVVSRTSITVEPFLDHE